MPDPLTPPDDCFHILRRVVFTAPTPMKRTALLPALFAASVLTARANDPLFIEAESFAEHGGWSLDTAFTNVIGSPYLLAHGLGKPVADATTKIAVLAAGTYRVWARTKDWVAPWKAAGTPGRFQVLVNGSALATEFGTTGADWNWQPGESLALPAGEATLALHDLTGFDGRCDALLFSNDEHFTPPDAKALAETRAKWNGNAAGPEDAGEFDLVVVGGGYSGLGAAISAARQALRVALVQDRAVLGGNGSSEIRVWAQGGTMRGKYPHIGEIVEEFADRAPDSPAAGEYFVDELKEEVCRAEKTLTLFLGHYAHDAAVDVETKAIKSVTALDVRTGRERIFRGKLFADCTGHGHLGAMSGAAFHMEPQGRMGMSNMWFWQTEKLPQPWPQTPWALAMNTSDFPRQVKSKSVFDGEPFMKAEWFWESGFNQDPIRNAELIRDWNLRAAFGAFSALKREDEYAAAALKWVSFVGGPRESRLLEGDVTLTREDIVEQRAFPDGCVPTTWDIDLHYPKEQFAKKFADNPFISRAEFGAGVDRKSGYPIPYRCLYSKNVPNLFMAGRDISVTHEALGTVRVMRTCGMMGEVVGKAAYLAVRHASGPRGVYESYLLSLIDLLEQPGAMRRASPDAPLVADPEIGKVRARFSKWIIEPAKVNALPGIVIDDAQAKLTGKWTRADGLRPFVGSGYAYADAASGAEARFEFTVPKTGRYEIRMAWAGHDNRASKAACAIEREGQSPLALQLDQREKPTDPNGFHSLGTFDFERGKSNAVVLRGAGVNGFLHADALQVIEAK